MVVHTFAQELAPRGITVNALLLGFTDTALQPDRTEDRGRCVPVQNGSDDRRPSQMWPRFLASDARWVTGPEGRRRCQY